jgi:ribosomal-protein-alanine N-acetyltransferase
VTRVRRAELDDLAPLHALEIAAFADDRPWSATSVRAELEHPDSLVLAADRGPAARGEVPAYAVWRRGVDEVELLRVAVHPANRRQGLAKLLLTSEPARVFCGDDRVHLEVREDNRPARALYESLGFRSIGKRPGYYFDGQAAVLYARGAERPA